MECSRVREYVSGWRMVGLRMGRSGVKFLIGLPTYQNSLLYRIVFDCVFFFFFLARGVGLVGGVL